MKKYDLYSTIQIKTFEYDIYEYEIYVMLADNNIMTFDLFNIHAFCYRVVYDIKKQTIIESHNAENYENFSHYFFLKIKNIYIKENGL